MKIVGSGGVIDNVVIGGETFIDMSNLIVLVGNAAAGFYTTLRQPDDSAGYQVPGGKTLKIAAIRAVAQSAGGNYSLGYGDTDSGILGSAPTSPVYMGGDSQNYVVPNQTTQEIVEVCLPSFSVPATKYAFIKGLSAGQYVFYAFGYLV